MADVPACLEAFSVYYIVVVSVVMAVLRLYEPIVRTTAKRDVVQCFTCRKDNYNLMSNTEVSDLSTMDSSGNEQEDVRNGVEDSDMLGDTLNAFLTSSLNVELVYTILKGIRRIVRTPDLETWKNGQVPENDTNDFSMRLTLDNIKIRNFKLWENAHQQQFLNDPNMPFETKVER